MLYPYEIVCCIYHAPHEVGESSSESSSDSSDSESDSGSDSEGGAGDDGKAKMGGKGKGKRREKAQEHDGNGGCNGHRHVKKHRGRNAYESQPKAKGGGNEFLKS